MKKKFKITDLLIGIVFTLFFLSIGVIGVINFRPLYYFDIDALNIESSSGLSEEIIKENYDALIDYSSPFFHGDLEFPSLSASEYGLLHFEEVKDIFVLFYYLAGFTFILLLATILYKRKKRDTSYLLVSSITSIVFPIMVALACVINFDTTFVVFHKIFFRNDYWYFDPELDPVITILPQSFFLHCAIFIIACILLGSLCLFLFSKYRSKKNGFNAVNY